MVRPAIAQTKRKSGDSCRLSHRFSCPLRGRQGNDKKVNEENSNFKNKGFVLSEEPLVEVHVSNVMPLLDTTYHFFGRITSPFFDFSPINVRKIAFWRNAQIQREVPGKLTNKHKNEPVRPGTAAKKTQNATVLYKNRSVC